MQNSPSTRLSLLARIRDAGDSDAWDQFVQIYAPLVYAFGRRHGLQDADAADLTQDVLRRVIEVAGGLEYDPRRGSFRGWLFTVTRNRLRDQWKRPHKVDPPTGETATLKLLAEKEAPLEDDSHWWDGEYERRLYEYAAGQVRRHVQPSTWEAFRLTALEGRGAQEVAGRLGMSVAAVYLAKGRIIRQLKELIRELTLE